MSLSYLHSADDRVGRSDKLSSDAATCNIPTEYRAVTASSKY